MTKYKDFTFLNSDSFSAFPWVDKERFLTGLTKGDNAMPFNPDAYLFGKEENFYTDLKRCQTPQTEAEIIAAKRLAYRKEKALLSTQRYRIAKLIIGQSKQEFEVLKRAFEILAQTDTGRQTVLSIPESTSYALSKLPSLAQMYGHKCQIIFSDDIDLYKKPLAETVDTMGHEYTHLINHQHIYGESFEETEADFFAIKMLDEITARIQASQMVHEARGLKLLPRKLGGRPMSAYEAFNETVEIGYPDLFVRTICEKRHISPFLLTQSKPVHSNYFTQKVVPYFFETYPALKEAKILENIAITYRMSVAKRTREMMDAGCKLPPSMAAALRRESNR